MKKNKTLLLDCVSLTNARNFVGKCGPDVLPHLPDERGAEVDVDDGDVVGQPSHAKAVVQLKLEYREVATLFKS